MAIGDLEREEMYFTYMSCVFVLQRYILSLKYAIVDLSV